MAEKILSISEIIAIEPCVKVLLEEAKRTRRADWRDYTWFKKDLSKLVGFGSVHEELQTCSAYETAINSLCDALGL